MESRDSLEKGWVDIRDPATGKLLARLKRGRHILEFKKGERRTMVDLRQYEVKNGD